MIEVELNGVKIIEYVWIEMSDGIRLSSKIWLPANEPKAI